MARHAFIVYYCSETTYCGFLLITLASIVTVESQGLPGGECSYTCMNQNYIVYIYQGCISVMSNRDSKWSSRPTCGSWWQGLL